MGCCVVKEVVLPNTSRRPNPSMNNSLFGNNLPIEEEQVGFNLQLPSSLTDENVFEPYADYVVHSNVKKKYIKVKDTFERKEDKVLYKFTCPVCFRHFNSMLQCSKCQNYVCQFCGDDIGDKSLLTFTFAYCPFCCVTPFVLEDVKEHQPIKHYLDVSERSFASPVSVGSRPKDTNSVISPRVSQLGASNTLLRKVEANPPIGRQRKTIIKPLSRINPT